MSGYIHSGVKGKMDKVEPKVYKNHIIIADEYGNSKPSNKTVANILDAINTVDAKLKDNTTDPSYSTLPEFEAYLKSKYGLTEA